MQDEREKFRDQSEGGGQQQPVGQDSPENEYGEIGENERPAGTEPGRSMGTKGTEFGQFGDSSDSGQQGQSATGQADLGTQGGSTLSGQADQQELGQAGGEVDQPGSHGSGGGQSGTGSQGFILQEGTDANDDQQESGSSGRATEGNDFAPQGRGALEGEQEDIEGAQSRSPASDIEQ